VNSSDTVYFTGMFIGKLRAATEVEQLATNGEMHVVIFKVIMQVKWFVHGVSAISDDQSCLGFGTGGGLQIRPLQSANATKS